MLQGMKKETAAFTECMELAQQGVDDVRYQELYQALSPEKRDLVDQARRMLEKIPINPKNARSSCFRNRTRNIGIILLSKRVYFAKRLSVVTN
jgi:hypothetical protein